MSFFFFGCAIYNIYYDSVLKKKTSINEHSTTKYDGWTDGRTRTSDDRSGYRTVADQRLWRTEATTIRYRPTRRIRSCGGGGGGGGYDACVCVFPVCRQVSAPYTHPPRAPGDTRHAAVYTVVTTVCIYIHNIII